MEGLKTALIVLAISMGFSGSAVYALMYSRVSVLERDGSEHQRTIDELNIEISTIRPRLEVLYNQNDAMLDMLCDRPENREKRRCIK